MGKDLKGEKKRHQKKNSAYQLYLFQKAFLGCSERRTLGQQQQQQHHHQQQQPYGFHFHLLSPHSLSPLVFLSSLSLAQINASLSPSSLVLTRLSLSFCYLSFSL